ncbi:SEL1-like repeat protein [Pinirhizobacter sp.]|jgi:hypothetical protein|uniref:SEL1-like repeat protein n=1 Tax=Pinirhizobacter sp. TaxID=2950432 RepID=UPI002F3F9153
MNPLRSVSLAAVVLPAVLLACNAAASDRPQPLPGQKAEVSQALMLCPSSLERILPGRYYMCEAQRDFWLGRQDQSMEMMRDAAAWGSKQAQYTLGIMYFNGQRTPVNRPLGLAWLAIAAERHDPNFEPAFISAFRDVTPAERDQANELWRQMLPKYADRVAAKRARTRYDREMRPLEYGMDFGGQLYLSGLTFGELGGTPGNSMTGSAFAAGRGLQAMAANYFYGWHENVTVGDLELVPVTEAARRMPRKP